MQRLPRIIPHRVIGEFFAIAEWNIGIAVLGIEQFLENGIVGFILIATAIKSIRSSDNKAFIDG